ncbi:MAG: TRAP transporter substrate-binding protein DctP [Spirochaetales bacterium]
MISFFIFGSGPLFPQALQKNESKVLRISLENTPIHVQVRNIQKFAEEVERRLSPGLKVEVYPEARLFRDRDVLNAVHTGKIEMAVPGTWNLEPFVPDLGLFLLPLFYGRSAEESHRLSDGIVGEKIQNNLERLYNVQVLGNWMDLGHAHVFTLQRSIKRLEDFKGLRIRVAGGKANELRLFHLGANAVVIPWSELLERLKTRMVDGVLSTYETIRSAELWKYGIRYAFEDNQYFPMYIPLVSRTFWNQCSEEEIRGLKELWRKHTEQQRQEAFFAQQEAKQVFIQNGGTVFIPPKEETIRIRQYLLQAQAAIVQQLGISLDLILLGQRGLSP